MSIVPLNSMIKNIFYIDFKSVFGEQVIDAVVTRKLAFWHYFVIGKVAK